MMRWVRLCGLVVATVGCAPEPTLSVPEAGVWTAAERDTLASLRLSVTPRPDPTNRWANDPGAARLGQQLFYDAGLSPSGRIACATCHQPARHFGDGQPLGTGIGATARHTPGIVGSQWGAWFFWDGRADSLWSQALGPLENPDEMGSDRLYVARYVLDHDGDSYADVFGERPDLAQLPARARPGRDHPSLNDAWNAMSDGDRETVDRVFANVGKALAAYERTLVPEPSPFDRYVDAVLDGDASGGGHLDEGAVRGLSLFLRDGGCVSCHNGPMLTDRAFHNLGLPEPKGFDPGRQAGAAIVLDSPFNCDGPYSDAADCPELRYLNPTFPDFVAGFKTPTLRYVAESAPYMHNGGFATLESVLEFYATLPGDPPAGHRELTLKPLELDPAETADLLAFLRALTGDPLPPERLGPPQAD